MVVSHVTGFGSTWAALLLLLALHLGLNYAAVRAVQMTSLNRQRANIVFSTLVESDHDFDINALRSSNAKQTPTEPSSQETWTILTPAKVSNQEHIFHRDGAIDWIAQAQSQTHRLGSACIGVSIPTFLSSSSSTKGHSFKTPIPIPQLTTLFTNESYLLFLSSYQPQKWHASILLKTDSTTKSQLKGWAHALLAARVLSESASSGGSTGGGVGGEEPSLVFDIVARTLSFLNDSSRFERYMDAVDRAGWNLEIAALETTAGKRVCST